MTELTDGIPTGKHEADEGQERDGKRQNQIAKLSKFPKVFERGIDRIYEIDGMRT